MSTSPPSGYHACRRYGQLQILLSGVAIASVPLGTQRTIDSRLDEALSASVPISLEEADSLLHVGDVGQGWTSFAGLRLPAHLPQEDKRLLARSVLSETPVLLRHDDVSVAVVLHRDPHGHLRHRSDGGPFFGGVKLGLNESLHLTFDA